MQIKRARLTGVRELVFEDVVVAETALAPTEIFAETECSAVSIGTELAAYAGEPPLRPGAIYPRMVGYCNVARVIRAGGAVPRIEVGQRILTHQSHQSGFVCEASAVLAPLGENDSSETAALSYFAQLGLAALQKARFQPGETVAVLGLGVIGLATVALAAALGARVLALGNDEFRLRKAAELGAETCLDTSAAQPGTAIEEATRGAGLDVILTTANSWAAWRMVLEISRFQSRIAVLGFPGRSEGAPAFNPLASEHFYQKQLSIFGAGLLEDSAGLLISPKLRANMEMILRLARAGRLPLQSLITHRVPWQKLGEVYETAARHDKTLLGAILNWRNPS